MVKTHYLSKELAKLSGLSGYMVSYLCREGLLRPKVKVRAATLVASRGYGRARMFSFADVLLARSIRKLLDAGVSTRQVRTSIRVLEQKLGQLPYDLVNARVTIVGKTIYLETRLSAPIELTSDGQMAFSYMLDLRQIRSRADRLVSERTVSDRGRIIRQGR